MQKKSLRGGNKGKTRHAFSLTELLVVIAILAILFSLLSPSLNRLADHSESIGCMNHQRYLGTLTSLYAEDYHQWLPPMGNRGDFIDQSQGGDYGGNGRFMTYLQGYELDAPTLKWGAGGGIKNPLFLCPSELDPGHALGVSDRRFVSYSANRRVWQNINGRSLISNAIWKVLPLSDIKFPSETVLITDGSDFDGVFDNFIDINLGVHTGSYSTSANGRSMGFRIMLRHQGQWGHNALFFDGRVEAYLAPDVSPSFHWVWANTH